MFPSKLSEWRGGLVVLMVAAVPAAPTIALADPLVGKTTSKVIATVAHIIVERVGGPTLDRIVSPYIDDNLVDYLSGDPNKIEPALVEQRTKIEQQMTDSSAEDVRVLKAQLELVQKELAAVKAMQAAPAGGAAVPQPSLVEVRETAKVMAEDIDRRGVQLAAVEQKLEDVSRVQRAVASDSLAPPAGASLLREPSFDCARARTEMEHLICDTPTLRDLDGRLGEAYGGLRAFLSPSQFQQLKREEIAWIRARDRALQDRCKPRGTVDMPCVAGLWRERIAQLEGQLAHAKARSL
jgi:uncharacterized protein YecT (DUF1311 family)